MREQHSRPSGIGSGRAAKEAGDPRRNGEESASCHIRLAVAHRACSSHCRSGPPGWCSRTASSSLSGRRRSCGQDDGSPARRSGIVEWVAPWSGTVEQPQPAARHILPGAGAGAGEDHRRRRSPRHRQPPVVDGPPRGGLPALLDGHAHAGGAQQAPDDGRSAPPASTVATSAKTVLAKANQPGRARVVRCLPADGRRRVADWVQALPGVAGQHLVTSATASPSVKHRDCEIRGDQSSSVAARTTPIRSSLEEVSGATWFDPTQGPAPARRGPSRRPPELMTVSDMRTTASGTRRQDPGRGATVARRAASSRPVIASPAMSLAVRPDRWSSSPSCWRRSWSRPVGRLTTPPRLPRPIPGHRRQS